MIVGQVIRLEVHAKKAVNCQIVQSVTAAIKNNGEVKFLIFSIAESATKQEKALFKSIAVGSVVGAQGHASTPDFTHLFATIKNIQILDAKAVPPQVFKPIPGAYTSFPVGAACPPELSILLVVKLVSRENRARLYCIDQQEQCFLAVLSTPNHAIKDADILVLRNMPAASILNRTVYVKEAVCIEVNPRAEPRRLMRAIRKNVQRKRMKVECMEEIQNLRKDSSIYFEGRVFRLMMSKNALIVSNGSGGIRVCMEEDAFERLSFQMMHLHLCKQEEDLALKTMFIRVRVSADIVFMDNVMNSFNVCVSLITKKNEAK
ncbi:uncharacterized protein NEMAJ01_0316 [Nematocida major]|uniref:uncharacterized protein n=1 Tax=Nematocida major TaxID=1912982 RepID=UPI0020080B90|nr:uncharacterized protein NEMAJ01_0316 [Nematocida major]KAH9385420.1 hypothetical protein NEMAJ01_0316 [Nematocida major]